MPYSNFFNMKMKLCRSKLWAKPESVNNFLGQLEELSFFQDRDNIRFLLNSMSTASYHASSKRPRYKLVGQDQRVTERELLYNMSHPTYLEIFSNLYSALDFNEEKCAQQSKTNGCSCNHNYDSALKLYASSVLQLKTAVLSGVGAYDRDSFEKEHDLQWTD